MLKIDKEESDNDSDKPIPKSVTNTPVKGSGPGAASNATGAPIDGEGNDDDVVYVNNIPPPVLPNKVSIFCYMF